MYIIMCAVCVYVKLYILYITIFYVFVCGSVFLKCLCIFVYISLRGQVLYICVVGSDIVCVCAIY